MNTMSYARDVRDLKDKNLKIAKTTEIKSKISEAPLLLYRAKVEKI